MLTFTVSRTYSETTPESAEDGDSSDEGFVYKDEQQSFREVVSALRECSEVSQCPVTTGHAWASTEYTVIDYQTGTDRSESIHVNAINGKEPTAHQMRRLFRAAGLKGVR